MWFTEACEVQNCLRHLEERLGDIDDAEHIRKDFSELICLLDSPLFCRLLSIEDALDTLRETSHDRSLDENDFDIDFATGELLLRQKRHKTDGDSHSSGEARAYIADELVEDKNANVLLGNQHVAEVHTDWSDEELSLDVLRRLAPGCPVESILLKKPDGAGIGLGFGIVLLRSESAELGVYVQSIQHGGVAER